MTRTPKTFCLYPYRWELAVHANLQRYPTNPRVPLLRHSEVVRDEISLSREEAEAHGITVPSQGSSPPGGMPTPPAETPPASCPTEEIIIPTSDFMDPMSPAAVPRAGVRTIVRRCQIDTELPGWVKKAINLEYMTFIHTTRIDSRAREMTIHTINETSAGRVRLGDYTCYRAPRPSDDFTGVSVVPYPTETPRRHSTQTLQTIPRLGDACYFEQYAFLELPRIPLASSIEKYALRNYTKNTSEGRRLDMLFMADASEAGGLLSSAGSFSSISSSGLIAPIALIALIALRASIMHAPVSG